MSGERQIKKIQGWRNADTEDEKEEEAWKEMTNKDEEEWPKEKINRMMTVLA